MNCTCKMSRVNDFPHDVGCPAFFGVQTQKSGMNPTPTTASCVCENCYGKEMMKKNMQASDGRDERIQNNSTAPPTIFKNDKEREAKEPYISIIGVLIDVEAKQQTVKESIAEIMHYTDALLKEERTATLREVMEDISGMQGILSHENVQEHTRRIHRQNTLDEVKKIIQHKLISEL